MAFWKPEFNAFESPIWSFKTILEIFFCSKLFIISIVLSVDPPSEKIHSITAPLVGTFYQSSKPGEPAFIKIGDTIKVGQTICIIEAMKIFNEIESEVNGIVMNVCTEDSSPVEYGQVLFDIQIND